MAWVYLRGRPSNRGTTLVSFGFLLWAIHSLGFPFVEQWPVLKAVAYVFWALSALTIAMGMVIEQEVGLSERKYRELFDNASEAIFAVDVNTQAVLDMNVAAQRLTGREPGQIIGKPFSEICPDLQKPEQNGANLYKTFSNVFRPYSQFAILRLNGSTIQCEGEMRAAKYGSRRVFQLHIREIGQNAKMGQQMRRAEKLSSLGQLVAGVAHELNNPLAVVVGFTQLLSKREDVDPKIRSELCKVLRESERAAKIVKNLLTFVRPAEPQLVPVDINRLLATTLEARQRDLAQHQIRVERRFSPSLPATKADPSQLEQVFANLIGNAIYAMGSQNRPGTLTVTTEENGFNIRVTVSDTGPGVPKEIRSQIFDPFFTTKPPGKGTGLGLTICNGIVEEHKGKIWVEGEAGRGAQFVVELPIAACETAPAPAEPVVASKQPDPKAAEKRLLIVDDEPGIVEVMVSVLGNSGYTVETACNGAEAMRRINQTRFDLIISDLCMPEMDGRKLYETIRERDPGLASRIIFVTGDTVSNNSRAFLETTGSTWLMKPFSIIEVEELVGKFLRREAACAPVGAN
jgi:two-component system NtrC family sensor kinase